MADSNSKKPMALLLLVVVAVLVVIMVNQGGSFAGFDGLGKDDCATNGGVFTATGDVTTAAVDEVAATCATVAVEAVADDAETTDVDETVAAHESVALEGWDGTADGAEDACTGDVDGHAYVYTALVPAVAEVKADADSCAAPDYTTLDEAGCTKAHGTWTAGADADDETTEDVDETKGSCAAWTAE